MPSANPTRKIKLPEFLVKKSEKSEIFFDMLFLVQQLVRFVKRIEQNIFLEKQSLKSFLIMFLLFWMPGLLVFYISVLKPVVIFTKIKKAKLPWLRLSSKFLATCNHVRQAKPSQICWVWKHVSQPIERPDLTTKKDEVARQIIENNIDICRNRNSTRLW